MNIPYISARIIRRSMPKRLVDFLRNRSIIFKPGIETANPAEAAEIQSSLLQSFGRSIEKSSIAVFGYGGSFGLAAQLLSKGASRVSLIDLHENLNDIANRSAYSKHPEYFNKQNGRVIPNPNFISVHHGDILDDPPEIEPVDLLLSSSVLEHIPDLAAIIKTLNTLIKPDGAQLHRVDLGDHVKNYPFEMLTYSETMWKKFLNPPSNLNRLRLWDYENVFNTLFSKVELNIEGRNLEAFRNCKSDILLEFLSGSDENDSVIGISIYAAEKNI